MKSFDYKKSFGQNFLQSKEVINKIADSIRPLENDLIVEIGPGAGALTKELVKKNVDVICFEIDTRLKEYLNKIDYNRLNVVFNDFLKVNLPDYIDTNKYNHIHFVGNLPYYITTAIINKIIDESDPFDITIMVQKEVGERIASKPHNREYGSLSVFLQYNFDIVKVVDVDKTCFEPIPKVDSVVVQLTKSNREKANNEEHLYKLIKDSFMQKRKNIRNNLKSYDLVKIDKLLKDLGKDLTCRAEELSVEEFIYLSNELSK